MSDIPRISFSRDLRRSGGSAFIYAIVMMVAICALVSLGVDLGRVQVAKTELQRAADAAARYGAAGLATNTGQATSNAIAAAAQNTADGTPVRIGGNDVSFGCACKRTSIERCKSSPGIAFSSP